MNSIEQIFTEARSQLSLINPYPVEGVVTEVRGPTIIAELSSAAIGDLVQIESTRAFKKKPLWAQVVGFSYKKIILTPFGSIHGLSPGAKVSLQKTPPILHLGPELIGSVLDSSGAIRLSFNSKNIDPKLLICSSQTAQLNNLPPSAITRNPISKVFETGIKAIDTFITLGKGQRIGIFAEPGVGKSTLLANIAASSKANVNVIGLIGERGREVQEFIYETLTTSTKAKTVIVASTSDEAANSRIFAALSATRVAEYFRDQGLDVLLMIDSLTRLTRAYREVGLAAGEVPVRRGYPPSVFAELPRLIERAGTAASGSITAIYTVLLSADLDEDPMVEEIKGLTDGHIMLSRELAERGQYPAIDVLSSISRLAKKLNPAEVTNASATIKRIIHTIDRDRDLINLSQNIPQSLKASLELEPEVIAFLKQSENEMCNLAESRQQLLNLANYAEL